MRKYLGLWFLVTMIASGCGGGGDYNAPPTQPSPPPVAPPAGATIVSIPQGAMNLGDDAFGGPATVSNGGTVSWTNGDSLVHNVVANNSTFNSGPMSPAEVFNFTFLTTGSFPYHCSIHPTMQGLITVQP